MRANLNTQTVEVDLAEGDTIVYLSDGIVEAQDENGEPLGFEQLEQLIAAHSDSSPSAIRDEILDAVAKHSGPRPADDDGTVMIVKFDSLRATAIETAPMEAALA